MGGLLRLHEALRPTPVVGWDLAFTPEGPVVIEGNLGITVTACQLAPARPLGQQPAWSALTAAIARR